MTGVNISVPDVDVTLLRQQRDWLLNGISTQDPVEGMAAKEGLLNLLDAMLDIAEGYPVPGGWAADGPDEICVMCLAEQQDFSGYRAGSLLKIVDEDACPLDGHRTEV